MRTLKRVGIAGGRRHYEGAVASDREEPGANKVTACTRAFEEIDAQMFPGPGRGATRSETAASDRWGMASSATVEAYCRMSDLVVKHQIAFRHWMSQHQTSNTVVAPNAATTGATNHQNEPARGEDRRV
jgi:hypothetical protein